MTVKVKSVHQTTNVHLDKAHALSFSFFEALEALMNLGTLFLVSFDHRASALHLESN